MGSGLSIRYDAINKLDLLIEARMRRTGEMAELIVGMVLGFAKLVRRVQSWLAEARERRMLADELYAMDSRQLADIGLTENDIPALLDGVFVEERRPLAPIQSQPAAASAQRPRLAA
jgi:uncharacterized protein YjiS (DUF1127 family)